MASTEIRDRRRTLRYRNLVLRQMLQMKNRVSGLLMESGVSHDKQRLHKMGYFTELFSTNEEINDSTRPLLRLSREHILRSQRLDRALTSSLERDPLLSERLRRLRTIPGVGPITALTWALEIGDYSRSREPALIVGPTASPTRHGGSWRDHPRCHSLPRERKGRTRRPSADWPEPRTSS
jgi:transposase